jgi:hypothetical protein
MRRANAQEHAPVDGFVSWYEVLAANCQRHSAMGYSAADRPAGTREALPGTIWRNLRSAFSSNWRGKRRADATKKSVAKKFFSRTEASA